LKGHVDLIDLQQQVEAFKRRMYEHGETERINVPEFIEKHMKIKDIKGAIIPFRMNSAQDLVWETMQRLEEEHEMIRLLILKIRQLGISTFIEAWLFVQCWLNSGRVGIITAHDWDLTLWIYGMSRRYYETMTDEMKAARPLDHPTPKVKEIHFRPPHDSRIIVGTAGRTNIGHGYTMQYWHGSEAARYRDGAGLMLGIGNAIHDVPGTAKIMESTAEGEDPFFYQHWKEAENGENEYYPLFLGLKEFGHIHAVNYEKMKPLKLKEDELKYQKERGIDDDLLMQFVIRKKRSPDCDNSWSLFDQQYPDSAKVAFSLSGRSAFNREALDEMERDHARDPLLRGEPRWAQPGSMDVVIDTSVDRPCVEIFEEVQFDSDYLFTQDVGHGKDQDYTIIEGFKVLRDYPTYPPLSDEPVLGTVLEQVVHYYTNAIEPWDSGLHIFMLGVLYNWAFLGIESNDAGLGILQNMERGFSNYPQTRGGYPFLYYQTRQAHRDGKETGQMGWLTTGKSKNPIITGLSWRITAKQIIYHSKRTINEHRGFYQDENKNYLQRYTDKFTGLKHDDEVMACAISGPVLEDWLQQPRLLPRARIEGF